MSRLALSIKTFNFILQAMPPQKSDSIEFRSIHGIHIETGTFGLVAVATTGEVMLVAMDDETPFGEEASFTILPTKEMIQACRLRRPNQADHRIITLDTKNNVWLLRENGGMLASGPLTISDIPYPRWSRICYQRMVFNTIPGFIPPAAMERITLAAKVVGSLITLHGSGSGSPVMVSFPQESNTGFRYFGLIKPANGACEPKGAIPDWIMNLRDREDD